MTGSETRRLLKMFATQGLSVQQFDDLVKGLKNRPCLQCFVKGQIHERKCDPKCMFT